jgi:hypothetical protein
LPDDVKAALRGHFSESTLNRAKYSLGNVQITLPNFIGKGQKVFGNDYAVVVDDIIVFNTTPPTYKDDPFWWAHEVTHVEQYESLGIEGFAYKYLSSLGSAIESEADNKAALITKNRSKVGVSQLNIGTFDMTGSSQAANFQQNPEYYVAQCIFPRDPYPVNYLLTNYGRIIAVNPMTGEWLHLGFAVPPIGRGVAWDYWTPNLRYAVMPDGNIIAPIPIFNPWGQIIGYNNVIAGYVIKLA